MTATETETEKAAFVRRVDHLVELRREQGYTLAQILGIAEMSQEDYERFRAGDQMTSSEIAMLAHGLMVDALDLLMDENPHRVRFSPCTLTALLKSHYAPRCKHCGLHRDTLVDPGAPCLSDPANPDRD